MLRIYIARHGQNEDNAEGILNGHRDRPLTELGRRQALELAAGIKERGLAFDETATSPLCRAVETGRIVCETLGLPHPMHEPDLIERHFGVMTGRPIDDIKKLIPPEHILETPKVTYFLEAPEAENYPDARARAKRLLDRTHAERTSGSLLWFAHSDIGKLLYGEYYGIPWLDMLSKFHYGNCELLVLEPGGSGESEHIIRMPQFNA